jgi:hypothetical protein
MFTQSWLPSDNQIVQMLVNRGHLDEAQVLFATAHRCLEGAPSVLEVLRDQGALDDALIQRVLKEARQDDMVREIVRQRGLLSHRELAEAHRLQRGTQRTLFQTLLAEGYCSRESLRKVMSDLARTSAPAPRAVEARWLSPLDIA